MNLTSYRKLASYGHSVRKKWSRNAVAAKARKRIERGDAMPEEPDRPVFIPKKSKTATVSIRCRGKAQAASTIGRRVALVLDAVL